MLGKFSRLRNKQTFRIRFVRYVLYALGEIILVVIGILIALQINNWNDEQKSEERSKYYLQSLINEFIINQRKISDSKVFHVNQLRYCNAALELLDNQLPDIALDTLHIGLMQIGWAWEPNFKQDVWSELLNTGQVVLIRNDTLRQYLNDYYYRVQEIIGLSNEWSRYNIHFREATGNLFEPRLRFAIGKSTGQYKMISPINEPLLSVQVIQERIQKVNNVGALITDVMIVRNVGNFVLNNLEEKNLRIQQLLSRELNRPY